MDSSLIYALEWVKVCTAESLLLADEVMWWSVDQLAIWYKMASLLCPYKDMLIQFNQICCRNSCGLFTTIFVWIFKTTLPLSSELWSVRTERCWFIFCHSSSDSNAAAYHRFVLMCSFEYVSLEGVSSVRGKGMTSSGRRSWHFFVVSHDHFTHPFLTLMYRFASNVESVETNEKGGKK